MKTGKCFNCGHKGELGDKTSQCVDCCDKEIIEITKKNLDKM